jgi:hypothetical protein
LRRKTKATIDNSIVASSLSSTPVRAIVLDLYEGLIALLASFSQPRCLPGRMSKPHANTIEPAAS